MRLNDSALKFRSGQVPGTELIASLEELWTILRNVEPASLDDKLADYVFFPLSSVLREREKAPLQAIELAIQCLTLLLQTGWREFANSELAIQLLILLTFLASSGSVAAEKPSSSDDLQAIAFVCKAVLFGAVSRSQGSKDALLSTQTIPALGHSVTVILDGVKHGNSGSVQLGALDALKSFFECFPNREMLSSFFPGITSSLTQVLTPSTKARRPFRVLEKALNVLGMILELLLSDSQWTADLVTSSSSTEVASYKSTFGKDGSWYQATASQVKLALSNVVRLRQHDRKEVRDALNKFCWNVLTECQQSLSESVVMMLETVIALNEQDNSTHVYKALEHHLVTNSGMAELLRGNLYDWLIALPRVMLSNDESAKRRSAYHIATTYSLLVKVEVDMSVIDSVILSAMADSLAITIRKPSQIGVFPASFQSREQSVDTPSFVESKNNKHFELVLTNKKQDLQTVTLMQNLIQKVASSTTSLCMARDALENARNTHDDVRLINMWLSFTILKERATQTQAFDFDLFVNIQPKADLETDVCDDLYAFALAILVEDTEIITQDWRLKGLALEILTLQATRLKDAFRVELVDALYPIVHLMASPVQALQNHAMTCLNLLATACGYENAQELLISNVDYLVNAIAIKLNTFDLSPEAPQVLLMMLKLCGPTLLVYLEDLVESIFEALECFHGYTSLVEMLFSVLRGVVEVGSQSPQFTITRGEERSHRKPVSGPPTISQVAAELRARRLKVDRRHEMDVNEEQLPDKRPDNSWPGGRNSGDDHTKPGDTKTTQTSSHDAGPASEDPAPLSSTYILLQRITALTQHHLPSSSPGVRTSLLSLLTTALPYLSHHDDTFLPLTHTLWPVLVPRLEDKEAYVVAGVLDVMGTMCEGAGDFVSSRIEALWPSIQKIHKGLQKVMRPQFAGDEKGITMGRLGASSRAIDISSMDDPTTLINPNLSTTLINPNLSTTLISSTESHRTQPSTGPYIPSTTLQIRASLTSFLVNLVNHVRLADQIYTEICSEMLYDALVGEGRSEVKLALEGRNPDAVWLLFERARGDRGQCCGGNMPRSGSGWAEVVV